MRGWQPSRRFGPRTLSSSITLIGDDPHGYYSRPGLAYYLTGEVNEKQLFPFNADDLRKLQVRSVRGLVSRIFPESHRIDLQDGSSIDYGALLLATGALATPLDVPGAQLSGVVKLDDLADARRILKLARRGQTAVVVGGGITALEIAEGLMSRGVKVQYLLRANRYWSSVLDEGESELVEKRLRAEGTTIQHHAELAEIQGRGHVQAIRLTDGRVLRCDLLAYAIGVAPRLQLARQAGLAVDRGILADQYMRTNVADIYAAGDVAQVYDPRSGHSLLDSLWGTARDQGRVAGMNMAGKRTAYVKTVASNITRLVGLATTIIGAVGKGRDADVIGMARGDSEFLAGTSGCHVSANGFRWKSRAPAGWRTPAAGGSGHGGSASISAPGEDDCGTGGYFADPGTIALGWSGDRPDYSGLLEPVETTARVVRS